MKRTYPIRNWPQYNQALKNRGNINVWFCEDSCKTWNSQKKTGKKGRPERYSDQAILTTLTLRALFQLPLRATEGFLESLFTLLKLDLDVPSFSQLSRRSQALGQELVLLSKKPITDLVIDSTGLKVYGEGEWKVRQHGASKRRTWRKLHLGVCPKSHAIVVESLTTNGVADSQVYPAIISSLEQGVSRTYADGAYDSKACYQAAHKHGTKLVVLPSRNAVVKQGSPPELSTRVDAVRLIEGLGGGETARRAWKKAVGYHKRSLAETAMYRFKVILGNHLRSRKLSSQQYEARVKCMLLNKLTSLGMPLRERSAA